MEIIDLDLMEKRHKAELRDKVKKERARIRKALTKSRNELEQRTPLHGGIDDPWIGAIRAFYKWAIEDVGR